MIWIENNRQFQIEAQLMRLDTPIASFIIEFSAYTVDIRGIKIINELLLPFDVRNDSFSLFDWLLSRGLIMRSHRNIFFTNLPTTTETRDFRLPFVFSLASNLTSLSDKYWLNPEETTKFTCNGAEIVFERKTWNEVDPFKNRYIPGILEQYGLNDTFFFEKPDKINIRSLIWSTSGSQNKRWMLDDDGYFLEKKLRKNAFENELKTFDFFLLNSVLVPKYTYYIKELQRDNEVHHASFNIDTFQEGLHVIQKRCLTDSNSYLESLSDYVIDDVDIAAPIRRMCEYNNVSKDETGRFIELIKTYQKEFDVEAPLIDTRNLGLLIDKNEAHPVVWGRLKMKRNWVGQIDE